MHFHHPFSVPNDLNTHVEIRIKKQSSGESVEFRLDEVSLVAMTAYRPVSDPDRDIGIGEGFIFILRL